MISIWSLALFSAINFSTANKQVIANFDVRMSLGITTFKEQYEQYCAYCYFRLVIPRKFLLEAIVYKVCGNIVDKVYNGDTIIIQVFLNKRKKRTYKH